MKCRPEAALKPLTYLFFLGCLAAFCTNPSSIHAATYSYVGSSYDSISDDGGSRVPGSYDTGQNLTIQLELSGQLPENFFGKYSNSEFGGLRNDIGLTDFSVNDGRFVFDLDASEEWHLFSISLGTDDTGRINFAFMDLWENEPVVNSVGSVMRSRFSQYIGTSRDAACLALVVNSGCRNTGFPDWNIIDLASTNGRGRWFLDGVDVSADAIPLPPPSPPSLSTIPLPAASALFLTALACFARLGKRSRSVWLLCRLCKGESTSIFVYWLAAVKLNTPRTQLEGIVRPNHRSDRFGVIPVDAGSSGWAVGP